MCDNTNTDNQINNAVQPVERMWVGAARKKYPDQWILITNIERQAGNFVVGDVVFVSPDEDAAHEKLHELDPKREIGNMGVFEGIGTVQKTIGGLERC